MMRPVNNPRLLFNKIPTGYHVPGETTVYDTTQQIDLDAPLNGGVLIKTLVLSIEPYVLGRMRSPVHSYTKGKPVENYGVGIILRSENPKMKVGDHIYGQLEFQAYIMKADVSALKVLENKEQLPWSAYIGVAGMPGQTAYIGWKLFSKAKRGETVFVSTAGGPVGSTVVQLAKSEGLKVIASAGSDEKVAFAKEVGADIAFNYKTKDVETALKELGHGIDIYWDNVGGESLEAAIGALNTYGRVINCGAISQYTATEPYGIKNLGLIIPKRISLSGFVNADHGDLLGEFYDVFPKKMASGEIKYREHNYHGLEKAEQAILDVLKGNNNAKAVIFLADS